VRDRTRARDLADGDQVDRHMRRVAALGPPPRVGVRRGKHVSIPELRSLREDNARQGFLEVGEYEIIMADLPVYLQDVARFAFLTGWRRGEILSLTWADVDRDGGVVRLRPEHSKNRQGRTLAIEGDLKPLIDRRRQARVVTRSDQTTGVADLV